MTDREILTKAMNIIGEYGHIENGKVVRTYSDLVKSIENFMQEVGMRTDITKSRIEFLKQFDYYVRNIIGDDEITGHWLMLGLPDEYTEDDLHFIATDEECWLNCVEAFASCCRVAGII